MTEALKLWALGMLWLYMTLKLCEWILDKENFILWMMFILGWLSINFLLLFYLLGVF